MHRFLLMVLLGVATPRAFAVRTSYHNANPIGWMHSLPAGEMPGWSGSLWSNLEINQSNIWNVKFDMKDRRTGATYTYKADFEQSSAIAEVGGALTENWALSVEIPYANRNGGFLDDFIDQFHQVIQSNRFLRHLNEDFGNSFVVQTNGVDQLATEKAEGVGNVKAKLKWWPLKWNSPTPGVCDCGFAISGQAKVPTQSVRHGLSSGHFDYSVLGHLGVPIGQNSAAWATAAVTKLGSNEVFAEWPRRDWLQMYELSLDLAMTESWGFILQARYESPLFMKEYLDYQYSSSDQDSQSAERVASAWNALIAWRGSESIGFRYRWPQGSSINFLFVEDWGLGDQDQRHDALYVNNAPDVMFLSQWHFVF